MKLVARMAFLLAAFPTVGCSGLEGNLFDVDGSVLSWLVVAREVKWPPAVRFLKSVLVPSLGHLKTWTTAATMVDGAL